MFRFVYYHRCPSGDFHFLNLYGEHTTDRLFPALHLVASQRSWNMSIHTCRGSCDSVLKTQALALLLLAPALDCTLGRIPAVVMVAYGVLERLQVFSI